MNAQDPHSSRRLWMLALIVTAKLFLFLLLGRTETIHFVYAGF